MSDVLQLVFERRVRPGTKVQCIPCGCRVWREGRVKRVRIDLVETDGCGPWELVELVVDHYTHTGSISRDSFFGGDLGKRLKLIEEAPDAPL